MKHEEWLEFHEVDYHDCIWETTGEIVGKNPVKFIEQCTICKETRRVYQPRLGKEV